MVDLWRDFWIRETGTGQQVAQLHDRYMMMINCVATVVYAVRRWPKRRYAAHTCNLVSFHPSPNFISDAVILDFFLCLKFHCHTVSWVLLMPCVFYNQGCFWNFVGLTTWFMISVEYDSFVELWHFFLLHTTVCILKWLPLFIICSIVLLLITVLPLMGFLPLISIVSIFFLAISSPILSCYIISFA